jgi:hypothetical protein
MHGARWRGAVRCFFGTDGEDSMSGPRLFVDRRAVRPGDVLVTRDRSIWARLIRIGGVFGDNPSSWNHVIVASHADDAGKFWGVEGRPGGVGDVVIADRIDDRWTMANTDQPKTDEQRETIVKIVRGMLGTPYDWPAIVRAAMYAIGAPTLFRLDDWKGIKGTPTHVVCSSLATWAYREAGVPCPFGSDGPRWATPYDWASWILRHGWDTTGEPVKVDPSL